MVKEQAQIKQMQAMMGKYLTEISELKKQLQELNADVKWLHENVAWRDRSGEDE
jgi:hypothetical protein